MRRSGSTILTMAIFLSMLASSGVRQNTSGRRGGATPPSVQNATSKFAKPSYTERHQQVLNSAVTKKEGEQEYQKQINDLLQQCCRDGVDFVVALVPDPVHTHLALIFDRAIDTIQEALQDDGYTFDRAVVPWDQETHSEPDDYELRWNARWYQEGREHLPGVMLFRPSGDSGGPKDPLAVMLVGETPTDGIRAEQFLNAISQIRQRTPTKKTNELKLRILGPTFSGSLASLKKLLTCGKPPCFRSATIFSGTVSGRKAVDDFRNQQESVNATFDTFQETDAVMLERFIEFIVGTSYGSHNYNLRDIAELSEDETTYGMGDWQGNRPIRQPPDSVYCGESREDSKKSERPWMAEILSYIPPFTVAAPPCSVLRLYFPREISQLRAAYQDNSGPANGTQDLPVQSLPHNFGVTGADDDTVASFSQKQTPLSQEAVLLSIVAELRKHAIQFVVLRATDPLDLLFLSHYLRAAYPQGRIVTLGADMLFPREVEDTSLHGILALSTYSVSPSANHQFYQLMRSGAERMFPSPFEIGTYNALHSLMTAEVFQVHCKAPGPVTENGCADRLWIPRKETPTRISKKETPTELLYLIQYGWREGGKFDKYNAPPVRLSALGHDGYWPVANLGPFEKEKTATLLPQIVVSGPPQMVPVRQFSPDPAPVEVPNSWLAIEVVAHSLACGFCLLLWFASVVSPSPQLAQFAPTRAGTRVWLIAAMGFFLILVQLILLWPFVHGTLDWNIIHARRFEAILATGMFLVFLITLIDVLERSGLFDTAARRRRAKRRKRPNLGNAAAIAVFVVASILLPSYALKPDKCSVLTKPEDVRVCENRTGPEDTHVRENRAGIRHFETLRAMQLTSGLSPILPIFFLLAAGLWWASHISSGWVLLDGRRPRLPSGNLNHPRVAAIGEDAKTTKTLLKALRPGFSSVAHYFALAGIGLGLLLLKGGVTPLRTIEHWKYERSQLSPFLIIAWAGIIGTTLRLWTIWFRSHQLLLALDSLPLRRAFQRLEGFSWKPIWKLGGNGTWDEYRRILAREMEALDSALNTVPLLDGFRQKINRHRRQMRTWYRIATSFKHPFSLDWAVRRKAEQRLIEHFIKFQRGVSSAAGAALNYAEESWSDEKEEPKRRAGQETAADLRVRACERFVSLVYVSFLLMVLARMRTLIVAIGGMYILILLAMTLYPFEPKAYTQGFLAATLIYIVAVVGLVFAQIHRDATLSHITDTKPGELGVDFWLRMASFVALPLFSLFASQFPEIGRFFYSWLQPALQALNR